jgi:hypothetical protein
VRQTFQQTLHIFKKDARHLRREITLVALIAMTFAALHARALFAAKGSGLGELALAVSAAFLIGRLVLAEAIPGDRQFWVTRPYRWQSLLGAKLLFIVVFVGLPIFLAQLLILIIDGFPLLSNFPGLLWSQVLLLTFIWLPIAAIAALNSGFAPFIFSQLIVLAAAVGYGEVMPPSPPRLGGVEWVSESIAAVALVAIAAAVLFTQYKSRRNVFSRWLAIGGVAMGAVLLAIFPWTLALTVQSHFSKTPELASSISVALDRDSDRPVWMPRSPKISFHVPVTVQGIPTGTEILADALNISLRSRDGRTVNLGMADCSELKRQTVSASSAIVSAVCVAGEEFFHRESGQPVTVRGSLYLTLLGNARSKTMPLSDEPANALDGLQCYDNKVRAEWDVYCRSAFRWPSRMIYTKLGRTNANSFLDGVPYSPFPANLSIEPIEANWASAFASGPAPTVRDVTIVTEEPRAHFRRDFEETGVRLNEAGDPSVRYLHPEKAAIQ